MIPDSETGHEAILRREAEFRLKTLKQFIGLEATLRTQGEKIDALNNELGERNTYIHQLHEERERLLGYNKELEKQSTYIHQLHQERDRSRAQLADQEQQLEFFAQRLQAEEERLAQAQLRLRSIEGSVLWMLLRPLHALERWLTPLRRHPGPTLAPAADFDYHLSPSLFRLFQGPAFTVQGWACPREERRVTAVRIRLGTQIFNGTYGLPAPAEEGRTTPLNPATGFQVPIEIPPGRSLLQLEFCFEDSEWRTLFALPVRRQSP